MYRRDRSVINFMNRSTLIVALTSMAVLSGCRTSQPAQHLKESVLNQDHGLKITKELLTDKSFTGLEPEPLESNSGFPKANILLPDLTNYLVSHGTVDVKFVINGVPKGLVAQQDRHHKWTNYKGSEIKYLRISLLEAGNKNVQAEIAVGANNITSFKKTLSLNKDTKFNPFIGLYALNIDPSSLTWAKISGINPPGTIE